MQQLHCYFKQLILAAALVFGSSAALAGPTYRVTLDTTAYTGTGHLSLSFSSIGITDPLSATVSNFDGSYGVEYDRIGLVSGTMGSSLLFANSLEYSELVNTVTLGGMFGFNVTFGDGVIGENFAQFSVMLYNEAFDGVVGSANESGSAVEIALLPTGSDPAASLYAGPGLASVEPTQVPEPAQLPLMLSSLALLAFMTRRRSAK